MPEASENKKELVKNYRNQIKDGLNEIKEQYFGVPFETAAKYLQEAGGPVGVLIDLTLRFSEAFAEKKTGKESVGLFGFGAFCTGNFDSSYGKWG